MPTGQYQRKPRVERIALTCEVCGKEMLLTPGALKSRANANPSGSVRFCSAGCMGKATTRPDTYLALTCTVCGKAFQKRHDQVARSKNTYCSIRCSWRAHQVEGAKWRDPDQIKAYMHSYVQRNKGKHNEQSRQWTQANSEKRKEIAARWREAHLDDIKVKSHYRRMSYKRGDLTAEEWAEIKRCFDQCCARCRKQTRLTLDHIIPISAGGQHTASNVQPLCKSCNSSKNNRTIDYRFEFATHPSSL